MGEGAIDLPAWHRVAVFLPELAALEHLARFVGASEVSFRPSKGGSADVDVVLTSGDGADDPRAVAYAERHEKPLVRVARGFFHSAQLGTSVQRHPLSLVVDDLGIYSDATRPSRLEELIRMAPSEPVDGSQRTRLLLDAVWRRPRPGPLVADSSLAGPTSGASRVVLVDQSAKDPALSGGLVAPDAPQRMLHWARREFPRSELVIGTRPEWTRDVRKSFLLSALGKEALTGVRLQVLGADWQVFDGVDHVVTATSGLGFDALVQGCSVSCFGVPFYAGWGVTGDHAEVPRRGVARTVEQIAYAAWVRYSRYVHPTYGSPCGPEEVLRLLLLERQRQQASRGRTVAVGFSGWKRRGVRPFLTAPGGQVEFVSARSLTRTLQAGGVDRVVVWGSRLPLAQMGELRDRNVAVERVEDGFLRSNQLGSDLTVPASLVRDRLGIYFDPSVPSDLERLLQEGQCTAVEIERAAALRGALMEAALTKYNVQSDQPPAIHAESRKVILVVGQVDDDASVLLGGGAIRSSGELVQEVRARCPDAFLLFKPHPDVIAGNRKGALNLVERGLVDHIEEQASSLACLAVAQEVHTLTSLLGFEALLRAVPVFTYGLPFYAGWGLTDDRLLSPRRSRVLTLDELIFQALIAYPLYVNPRTGYHSEVEEIVFELRQNRARHGPAGVRASLKRQLGRAWRYLGGLLDAG